MDMKRLLLTTALLVGLALSAEAQTVATTTTLAADLAATATTMTVTSATGFTVGNSLLIDAEVMVIRAVSGTAVTVGRGQQGTAVRAHDNAERIITGASNHFNTQDPDYGQDCTRGSGQAAFSPWINVRTGTVWICFGTGASVWSGTNTQGLTFNSIPTSF